VDALVTRYHQTDMEELFFTLIERYDAEAALASRS